MHYRIILAKSKMAFEYSSKYEDFPSWIGDQSTTIHEMCVLPLMFIYHVYNVVAVQE